MAKGKVLEDTPLIKQFFSVKAQHPEAVLLYRVGDFYESYSDDAVLVSKVLGIVQTKKSNGDKGYIELAGFPHHAIDVYLPKLVRAGYKVAVCDQLEDPKFAKKLVKRGVTELVTPGVAFNDQLLDQKENNFLAGLAFDKDQCGAAFLDVSTGSFQVAQGSLDYIGTLIASLNPKEVSRKSTGTIYTSPRSRSGRSSMTQRSKGSRSSSTSNHSKASPWTVFLLEYARPER